MPTSSPYLGFTLNLDESQGRKTEVWNVRATRDYALLGRIRWFGRWRQYAFFPEPGTTFSPDCLAAISDKCLLLTQRHRQARGERTHA